MGEFSVRGGIIDIFPMTEENPIRIEFFDDEVDSIRYFSTETNVRFIKSTPCLFHRHLRVSLL